MADLISEVAAVQDNLSRFLRRHHIDPNVIYARLESCQFVDDRVGFVTRQFLWDKQSEEEKKPEVIDLTDSVDDDDDDATTTVFLHRDSSSSVPDGGGGNASQSATTPAGSSSTAATEASTSSKECGDAPTLADAGSSQLEVRVQVSSSSEKHFRGMPDDDDDDVVSPSIYPVRRASSDWLPGLSSVSTNATSPPSNQQSSYDDDGHPSRVDVNAPCSLLARQEEVRQTLLREARLLHRKMRNRSVEEIYAYLEANVDDANRVQLVHDLFLDMELIVVGGPTEAMSSPNMESDDPMRPSSSVDAANGEVEGKAAADELLPSGSANIFAQDPANCWSWNPPKMFPEVGTLDSSAPTTSRAFDFTDYLALTEQMERDEFQPIGNAAKEMAITSLTKDQQEQEGKGKLSPINSQNGEKVPIPPKESQMLLDMFPDMDPEYLNRLSFNNSPQWMTETVTWILETGFPRRTDGEVREETEVEDPQASKQLIETQYESLLEILPDADPSYLREQCDLMAGNEEAMKKFVLESLEGRKYPTLKDYLKRKEVEELHKKYMEQFNVEDFIEIFPDPFAYFHREKKNTVESFPLGMSYLRKRYSQIRLTDIQNCYKDQDYSLARACKELDKYRVSLKRKRGAYDVNAPTTLNLPFIQEVAFIENEEMIREHLKRKAEDKQKAFEQAQAAGELLQCQCCYDAEVLREDMSTCDDGHLFCHDCVRRGAETQIGDGKTAFPCFVECKSEFSLKTLQAVLKPSIFSRLLHRKQVEEVKAAGIPGLEVCPFCDFATIPVNEDKIFHCLNPDCMKETCRSCKQLNHVPLHCDEVEQADEIRMRTYIEDKMTEALVRTCWSCHRKFIKEDGCNKMQCTCGALMCYICRQPVKNYSHFNPIGGPDVHKCPLFSNNTELHVKAVEKQAQKAKKEILEKNPGRALKHDPTMILPEAPLSVLPVPQPQQPRRHHLVVIDQVREMFLQVHDIQVVLRNAIDNIAANPFPRQLAVPAGNHRAARTGNPQPPGSNRTGLQSPLPAQAAPPRGSRHPPQTHPPVIHPLAPAPPQPWPLCPPAVPGGAGELDPRAQHSDARHGPPGRDVGGAATDLVGLPVYQPAACREQAPGMRPNGQSQKRKRGHQGNYPENANNSQVVPPFVGSNTVDSVMPRLVPFIPAGFPPENIPGNILAAALNHLQPQGF